MSLTATLVNVTLLAAGTGAVVWYGQAWRALGRGALAAAAALAVIAGMRAVRLPTFVPPVVWVAVVAGTEEVARLAAVDAGEPAARDGAVTGWGLGAVESLLWVGLAPGLFATRVAVIGGLHAALGAWFARPGRPPQAARLAVAWIAHIAWNLAAIALLRLDTI